MASLAIRMNILRLVWLLAAGLTHPQVLGTALMAAPLGQWLSGEVHLSILSIIIHIIIVKTHPTSPPL